MKSNAQAVRISPGEYTMFTNVVKRTVHEAVFDSIVNNQEFNPTYLYGRYYFDKSRFMPWRCDHVTEVAIEPSLAEQMSTSALGGACKDFPEISMSLIEQLDNIFRRLYPNRCVQVVIKGGCAQYILLREHPLWKEVFEPHIRFNDLDASIYINPNKLPHGKTFEEVHAHVSDITRMQLARHKVYLDDIVFRGERFPGYEEALGKLKTTTPAISAFRSRLIEEAAQISDENDNDTIIPVLGKDFSHLLPDTEVRSLCASFSSNRVMFDAASDPILNRIANGLGVKLPPPFVIQLSTPIFVARDQTFRVLRYSPLFATSSENVAVSLQDTSNNNRVIPFHFSLYRLKWMFRHLPSDDRQPSCARAHFLDISVPKSDDASLINFWSSEDERVTLVNYMGRIKLPVQTLKYAVEELTMLVESLGATDSKHKDRVNKLNVLLPYITVIN